MTEEERKFILERAYNGWKLNIYVFDASERLTEVYDRENPAWKEGARPSGKEEFPQERAEFLSEIRRVCIKGKRPTLLPEQEGDLLYLVL